MTVNLLTTKKTYNGDGAIISFTYPFRILEESDLLVIVTDESGDETTLILNSDYIVYGEGDLEGGTISLMSGALCPEGSTITLMRNMDLLQETDYVNGDAYSAESYENALDKTTMVLQQFDERLDRSLSIPRCGSIGMEIDGVEFVNRANKAMGFNLSGAIALLPTALSGVIVSPGGYINVADAPYNGSLTAVVAALGGTECDILVDSTATLSATVVPMIAR